MAAPDAVINEDRNDLQAPVLFLFINCLWCIGFYQTELGSLLSTAVDAGSPDMTAMRLGFMGYIAYAAALSAFLCLGGYLLIQLLHRRMLARVSFFQWMRTRFGADPGAILLILMVTLLGVLVYVETEVFGVYGIHFYHYEWFSIVSYASAARDLGISAREIREGALAVTALVLMEVLLFWLCCRIVQLKRGRWGAGSTLVLLGLLVAGMTLYHLEKEKVWVSPGPYFEALPLRAQLTLEDSYWPHIPVEMRTGPGAYPPVNSEPFPTIKNKKNIVLVIADGLRSDFVTRDPNLMPHLFEFADANNAFFSNRHYSTSHFTAQGLFGILFGLDAYQFHPFARAHARSYPLEVLKANGYRVAFINGSPMNQYPNNFMMEGMDEVLPARGDDAVVRQLAGFLERRKEDRQPYLVVVFFYTPHYPFPAKKEFRKFSPNWHDQDFDRDFHEGVLNTYRNSVINLDDYFRQVRDLVRADFEEERTALILTSDHGTELWDHGLFGHGRSTFWNEKIQVPLMMALPGRQGEEVWNRESLTSHVDLWPTLLHYLQATPLPEPETYSNGIPLLAPPGKANARTSPIMVTGRYFPFTDRPSAIIDAGKKHWVKISSAGHGRLRFDLERLTVLDDRALETGNRTVPDVRGKPFSEVEKSFWRFLKPSGPL